MQRYLRQSVPMSQPAGRPHRADSNRADGFFCTPWNGRDHQIGVPGSKACANSSVCLARLNRHARCSRWSATYPTPDLRERRDGADRQASSVRDHEVIHSGVAGGGAGALELFAHATQSRAAITMVAPIPCCTKRIICASAQATRRGRPARWPTLSVSRRKTIGR